MSAIGAVNYQIDMSTLITFYGGEMIFPWTRRCCEACNAGMVWRVDFTQYRVGDPRLNCDIRDREIRILVVTIGDRKEIHRKSRTLAARVGRWQFERCGAPRDGQIRELLDGYVADYATVDGGLQVSSSRPTYEFTSP